MTTPSPDVEYVQIGREESDIDGETLNTQEEENYVIESFTAKSKKPVIMDAKKEWSFDQQTFYMGIGVIGVIVLCLFIAHYYRSKKSDH